MCVCVCVCVCMRTYIPACVDVGFEYGYVSSFAVSRHEYSRGCTYQDSGKSSHNQSEAGAWVPLPHLAPSPEEPRTSIRTEASKAYGQLLLHSPLPWAAAPTTGCLGLFMPPSSVHFLRLQAWGVLGFFFLSKATDLKKKSSKGQLQNQLDLEAIFP